jgi:hypothetical protein
MTRTTIRSEDITAGQVKSADLASDAVDTSGLEDDIAILGFKVAANGSLGKYDLVDQTIDAFEDATGIDASTSTAEARDNAGNYYKGVVATPGQNATGGTITTSGGNTIHTFNSDANFVAPSSGTVDYLIVGGGGGAEHTNFYGGGGGAGGYLYATGLSISAATHAAVIGAAGVGGSASKTNGGDSSIFSLTAVGGGYGNYSTPFVGADGGSGGGGNGASIVSAGGSATAGQGYAGGSGAATDGAGGGGGGSASAGGDGTAGSGGGSGAAAAGGAGTSNSISGSAVYYAAGGASGYGWNSAAGGAGPSASDGTGWADADNRGHGGSANNSTNHPYGSSGVVIVSYTTGSFTSDVEGNNMTLVSTTTTAQSAPTKGDIVFTYTNGVGSTVLGTDVTAEFSADGGSTWTSMTLGSEGTTGGHTIATAHDVALTSTSGTSMAYRIKTLNQSVSKTTRIQAVSLGWS